VDCPACGAKVERYARVCGECGAPLPEPPKTELGPGVVGASDAETRWAVGRRIALVVVILAIVSAIVSVVVYLHEPGRTPPESTASTIHFVGGFFSPTP